MAMMTEVLTTAGILAFLGLALKWLHGRVIAMEGKLHTSLYRPDHQPIYMSRDDCLRLQNGFCAKIEEIKTLIIEMDKKREEAKDDFRESQSKIENRLTAIETELKSQRA